MEVFGLRRVSIGERTRLVRAADVPGTERSAWSRLPTIAGALVVMALLGFTGYSLFWANPRQDRESAIQQVALDSSSVVQLVSSMYQRVIGGAAASDVLFDFAPGATTAASDLVTRYSLGKVQSYSIDSVRLPGYKWPPPGLNPNSSGETVALVDVSEYGENGTSQVLEYKAVRAWGAVDSVESVPEVRGRWLIRSVGQPTEYDPFE